jgi:hypothetical protein
MQDDDILLEYLALYHILHSLPYYFTNLNKELKQKSQKVRKNEIMKLSSHFFLRPTTPRILNSYLLLRVYTDWNKISVKIRKERKIVLNSRIFGMHSIKKRGETTILCTFF